MTVPIKSEVAPIGPQALADLLGRWPAADGPLYRLLAARIGRLADTGELPPGIRLPPERALAATLAVSRNTVALAYQVLRDDGMAESRQGSGTRLMPHRITPAAAHRANGYFAGMLGDAVAIDLSIGAVDCAPAVAEALQSPRDVLGHRELSRLSVGTGYLPYGLAELRAAIASMLTTAHSGPHVGGRGAGHHRRAAGAGAAGPVRGLARPGGRDRRSRPSPASSTWSSGPAGGWSACRRATSPRSPTRSPRTGPRWST